MRFSEWKQSAELVGLAAVVASLVFVGLQLKQSQAFVNLVASFEDPCVAE